MSERDAYAAMFFAAVLSVPGSCVVALLTRDFFVTVGAAISLLFAWWLLLLTTKAAIAILTAVSSDKEQG